MISSVAPSTPAQSQFAVEAARAASHFGNTTSISNATVQYVIAKLHLPDAHRVATGRNVLVAVIDSGIDTKHPDLAGTVAATFDVLGPHEAHFHGTAMAGAIAAQRAPHRNHE